MFSILQGKAKSGELPFAEVMTGYTYRHRVYAMKRFVVDSLDQDSYKLEKPVKDYHKRLYEAIKECCITKVCGVFEIGPRPVQPMGFDLITYNDCIDFCMEKCENIGFKWEKIKEENEKKRILK